MSLQQEGIIKKTITIERAHNANLGHVSFRMRWRWGAAMGRLIGATVGSCVETSNTDTVIYINENTRSCRSFRFNNHDASNLDRGQRALQKCTVENYIEHKTKPPAKYKPAESVEHNKI